LQKYNFCTPDSEFFCSEILPAAVWTYMNGGWQGNSADVPEAAPHFLWEAYPSNGLWVYSPAEKTVTMTGWTYDALKYYTADDKAFRLLGTGEAIDSPLAKFQAFDPNVGAVWTRDSSGNPVQNPAQIKAGESFWVSKSATEPPPSFSEPPLSVGLQYAVMILKILVGLDAEASIEALDMSQNGVIGMEDVIFGLQQTAGLR
jgi:hypothetical protein